MMRTVMKHPLAQFAQDAGISLTDLSEKVGLTVKVLQGFAEGVIPLSARRRLKILAVLSCQPPSAVPATPSLRPLRDHIPAHAARDYNLQVLEDLYQEAIAESTLTQDTEGE